MNFLGYTIDGAKHKVGDVAKTKPAGDLHEYTRFEILDVCKSLDTGLIEYWTKQSQHNCFGETGPVCLFWFNEYTIDNIYK